MSLLETIGSLITTERATSEQDENLFYLIFEGRKIGPFSRKDLENIEQYLKEISDENLMRKMQRLNEYYAKNVTDRNLSDSTNALLIEIFIYFIILYSRSFLVMDKFQAVIAGNFEVDELCQENFPNENTNTIMLVKDLVVSFFGSTASPPAPPLPSSTSEVDDHGETGKIPKP